MASSPLSDQEKIALSVAADRLHHLSMRYIGSLAEVARGKRVGFLERGEPGVHEMRDLIDLVLLTRAEISSLIKLLTDRGVFSYEDYSRQVTDDYRWLAERKAEQFGVEITDVGLRFKKP